MTVFTLFRKAFSDHIPRADSEKKQERYQTLSTGRTEAIARSVLSQRVVKQGSGFVVVRYLVNLHNYGASGATWYERVTFTTRTIDNEDGSRSSLYDTISFEVLGDLDQQAPLTQAQRSLLFLLDTGTADRSPDTSMPRRTERTTFWPICPRRV